MEVLRSRTRFIRVQQLEVDLTKHYQEVIRLRRILEHVKIDAPILEISATESLKAAQSYIQREHTIAALQQERKQLLEEFEMHKKSHQLLEENLATNNSIADATADQLEQIKADHRIVIRKMQEQRDSLINEKLAEASSEKAVLESKLQALSNAAPLSTDNTALSAALEQVTQYKARIDELENYQSKEHVRSASIGTLRARATSITEIEKIAELEATINEQQKQLNC